MLLSRLAENMFWLGVYLERAENLSRAVLTHGRMCLDLPVERSPGFAPLLELCGHEPEESKSVPHEEAFAKLLVAEPPYSSVLDCVTRARDNLRRCRAVLPREAWDALNPVYVDLSQGGKEWPIAESLRTLESVMATCERVVAILHGSLTRDDAYSFLTLGQHIERADILLRFVEVVSGASGEEAERLFEDVRFMGLLESLGAYQMFRRSYHGPADPAQTLRFLLKEARFPRSLAFSLQQVRSALEPLPDCEQLLGTCAAIEEFHLPNRPDHPRLYAHHLMDRLAALSSDVQRSYFH